MSENLELYKVLEAPLISEKSTMCLEKANQVVFKVATWANKAQIKEAVEKLFSVNVVDVQTSNVNGKQKRFGKMMGRRKDWKKAVVRLKENQSVDFFAKA